MSDFSWGTVVPTLTGILVPVHYSLGLWGIQVEMYMYRKLVHIFCWRNMSSDQYIWYIWLFCFLRLWTEGACALSSAFFPLFKLTVFLVWTDQPKQVCRNIYVMFLNSVTRLLQMEVWYTCLDFGIVKGGSYFFL